MQLERFWPEQVEEKSWLATVRKRGKVIYMRYVEKQIAILLGGVACVLYAPAAAYAQDATNSRNVAGASSEGEIFGEIVVTAQKREQRLADIPIPVTAVSADALASSGQVRLEDYITSVPGVSLAASNGATAEISIRGLSSGGGNPTVGILIDDVAIGAAASYAQQANDAIPNLNPKDLERVEVLRGPQGTLYGASSLGGLIKFVTKDPSTSRLSGEISAGLSTVRHGSDVGYNGSASVNLPATDKIAFVASGYFRNEPGYIDNLVTGQKDVNDTSSYGGHLASKWYATDDITIKLGLLYQNDKLNGSQSISRLNGNEYGQNLVNRDTRGTFEHNELILGTVNIGANIGAVHLDSITGYLVRNNSYGINIVSSSAQTYFGADGALNIGRSRLNKFSQEFRATVPLNDNIDLLAGAYYGQEESYLYEEWSARDAVTGEIRSGVTPSGVPTDRILIADWFLGVTERALFANLTWKATDRLEFQLGGRQSWNEQSYTETDYGPTTFNDPNTYTEPLTVTKDRPFVYLVSAKYDLTPDWMTYARLATGYRAGGVNSLCQFYLVPCQFKPDTTRTMEIGVKGDVIKQYLFVDLSVYNIDWRNIQLNTPQYDVLGNIIGVSFGNGGKARGRGVELAFQSKPVRGLVLSGSVVKSDAELRQDLLTNSLGSGGYGVKGDPLPYSAKWSGNVSAEVEVPLAGDVTGSLGGSMTYVGKRLGTFANSSVVQRFDLPAYTSFDAHAGLQYEDWKLNLYVNNISDKRGVIARQTGSYGPRVTVIRPRTVGLSLSKSF